ncbi:MAG: GTPase Era [Clostridiales bacterium]|nr:GTPase Era [Eubacteriales bacterium]MDH7565331.1 GTPase Era [Clostridiales bacterium]
MSFKSGFVTIVGRPNVGKSTLLNRLAGEKIAIVSNKPQTTRNTIKTVITKEDFQMVFMDTPGIHKPKNKLGEFMVNVAESTLKEVDAVLFVIESTDVEVGGGDKYILEQLKKTNTPVFLIINKIDLVKKEQILSIISRFKDEMDFKGIIPISALNNEGIDIILDEIKKVLPEGPKYFPDDMLTDQPEKDIIAELIREKILLLVSDEIPHGIGVEVTSFKERRHSDIIDIQANIYCEKESHKGILIGKQGGMLKKIGTLAREEAEHLLDAKIFMELWVKVKPDWRNNKSMLRTLGYNK